VRPAAETSWSIAHIVAKPQACDGFIGPTDQFANDEDAERVLRIASRSEGIRKFSLASGFAVASAQIAALRCVFVSSDFDYKPADRVGAFDEALPGQRRALHTAGLAPVSCSMVHYENRNSLTASANLFALAPFPQIHG